MTDITKIKPFGVGGAEYDIKDASAARTTDLTTEANARVAADTTLSNQISDLEGAVSSQAEDISGIEEKIPAQASATNQLADKNFVNSSIQTSTAHFRGNWENWTAVPSEAVEYPIDDDGNHDPTSNDYMVIQDASDFPVETGEDALAGTWRFKYSGTWMDNNKYGWHPEYQVNETPLTAAQLAALNSNITAEAVEKLDGIPANAEANTIDSISVNGTAVTPDANKNVNLTIGETVAKVLTTNDYNYPDNNPTMVLVTQLPNGIYKAGSGVDVSFNGMNVWRDGIILIKNNSDETSNMEILFKPANDSWKLYTNNTVVKSPFNVVDNLSSTSTNEPLSAKQGKYLNDNKADKTAFTGTDGTAAGAMGLVPAPATTDADKFLKSDGTWASAGGDSVVIANSEWNSTTARYEVDLTYSELSAALNAGKTCVFRDSNGYCGFIQLATGSNNVFARVWFIRWEQPNWYFGVTRLTHNEELVYEYARSASTQNLTPATPDSISAMGTSINGVVSESSLKNILKKLDDGKEPIGTTETLTITTNDWTTLSSSDPYDYSTTAAVTTTIGADSTVELLNNQAVLFANYGFCIGEINTTNNTVTIYSVGQPSASVNLKINVKG